MAGCAEPTPGRVTTRIPMKPTPIAAQRRAPTHSPSAGPDSAATKNGVEKRDRQHLIEAHVFESEEIEHGRAEQHGRTADLEGRPRRHEQRGTRNRVGDDESEQQRAGVARPHHLHHIDVPAEIFRRGVEARKRADRAAHQHDAPGDAPASPMEERAPLRVAAGDLGLTIDHALTRYRSRSRAIGATADKTGATAQRRSGCRRPTAGSAPRTGAGC